MGTMAGRKRTGRSTRTATPKDWDLPSRTFLYADPSSATLDLEEVASYLEGTLGLDCEVRGDFFSRHGGRKKEGLARAVASTPGRDIKRPLDSTEAPHSGGQLQVPQ